MIRPDFKEKVFAQKVDVGEMFDVEVGVYIYDDSHYAYVQNGWGAGVQKRHSSFDEAYNDISRLYKRYYGLELSLDTARA